MNTNVQTLAGNICLVTALLTPVAVQAAVFRVAAPNGVGDVYGPHGLVAAINEANVNSEANDIVLEPGTYTLTRKDNDTDGPNGLPTITSVLTLSTATLGQAGSRLVVIERSRRSGAQEFRIFHVSSGALTLMNVAVRNGNGVAQGGGIFNRGRLVVLTNSEVGENQADQGGGVFNGDNGGSRPSVLALVGDSSIRENKAAVGGGGGIFNSGILLIKDSNIFYNHADFVGGGGIKNVRGTATLDRSTVGYNSAEGGGFTGGGGIENRDGGLIDITNSTISGNGIDEGGVASRGGGINNDGGSTVNLSNVTVTNNRGGTVGGGGIANGVSSGSKVNLKNSILAGNTPDECRGGVTSQGFNLLGSRRVCPFAGSTGDRLGAAPEVIYSFLMNNGGLTATHALFVGSLAVNSGSPALPGSGGSACEPVDQRGFRRPAGGGCDIGALELNASPVVTTTGPARRIITANTVLSEDRREGIVIGKDNIVLDCNGHKIEGTGLGFGIDLRARHGVTVRNCVVANFHNGIDMEQSTLNMIVHNRLVNNRNDGVHIFRAAGNIFEDNTVEDNDDDGFDLGEAAANVFRANLVRQNGDTGINLDGSLGNFVMSNTSSLNGDAGFRVAHGSLYNAFVFADACNNRGGIDFEESSHPNFFQGNALCKAVGIRAQELIAR